MQERAKLIISIKEARKLLGKDADRLSDDEIADVIITLTALAAVFLRTPIPPSNQDDPPP